MVEQNLAGDLGARAAVMQQFERRQLFTPSGQQEDFTQPTNLLLLPTNLPPAVKVPIRPRPPSGRALLSHLWLPPPPLPPQS